MIQKVAKIILFGGDGRGMEYLSYIGKAPL